MCWWLASGRPQRSIKSITGRGIHQLFLRQQKTLPWISFSAGQSGSFLPTPVSWPESFLSSGYLRQEEEGGGCSGRTPSLSGSASTPRGPVLFPMYVLFSLTHSEKLEHLRLPSMRTKSKHADCDQYQTWIHDFLLTNKMVGGQHAWTSFGIQICSIIVKPSQT